MCRSGGSGVAWAWSATAGYHRYERDCGERDSDGYPHDEINAQAAARSGCHVSRSGDSRDGQLVVCGGSAPPSGHPTSCLRFRRPLQLQNSRFLGSVTMELALCTNPPTPPWSGVSPKPGYRSAEDGLKRAAPPSGRRLPRSTSRSERFGSPRRLSIPPAVAPQINSARRRPSLGTAHRTGP